MSSFGISLGLFTTLLLASILPLSVGNDYLFSTLGVVLVSQGSSLQTVHAQEQDEETDETEDENEEESQPDDDDNNEVDGEEEDNGQTDSIGICCSWDERLADVVLTYSIIERVDEDDDEDEDEEGEGDDDNNQDEEEFSIDDLSTSDSDQRRAVTDAVNEWNTRIPNLRLANEDSNVDADIEVQLVDGLGGMAAGATLLRFDEDGFINKATVLLPKAAFFIEGESQIFAVQNDPQKQKEIATHELGHALGLGHADFDSDLMSESLDSDQAVSITQCHIDGILQANQWKLISNNSEPDNPIEDEVSC